MDNTIMCGIDAGTVGYCKWSDLNWWYRIGNIDIKHISVSNGKLLALNTNNKVYYANEMKEFPDWKEITSGVNTQVDLNGTFACTVNKNGDGTYTTMCNENILNDASEWKEIPGNYKHISIGQLPTSKKYLYGIAPDNTAWKTTS